MLILGYGKYITVKVNGIEKDTAKGEKLSTLNTVADLAEYGKYFKNDGTLTSAQTAKLVEGTDYALLGKATIASNTPTYGAPGAVVSDSNFVDKCSKIGNEYKANTEIKYTTGDLAIDDTGFYKVELVNAAGEAVKTDYKKTGVEVIAAGTANEYFRYNDGAEKFHDMSAALNVGSADLKVYVDANKEPVKYAKFANVSLTDAGASGLTAKSEIAWKDGIVAGADSYLVLGTEALLEVTPKGYKNETQDTTITLTNATYKTINTLESGIDGIKGYEGTSTTVLVLQKNTTLNGSFTITAGIVTATDPTPTVAVTVA